MVVDCHDAAVTGVMMVPLDAIRTVRMRMSMIAPVSLESHGPDDVAVLVRAAAVFRLGDKGVLRIVTRCVSRDVEMRRSPCVQIDCRQCLKRHEQGEQPGDCRTQDQFHCYARILTMRPIDQ